MNLLMPDQTNTSPWKHSGSYQFKTDLWDMHWTVFIDYQAPEKATHTYPGCPEQYDICAIRLEVRPGKNSDVLKLWIDMSSEFISEHSDTFLNQLPREDY